MAGAHLAICIHLHTLSIKGLGNILRNDLGTPPELRPTSPHDLIKTTSLLILSQHGETTDPL